MTESIDALLEALAKYEVSGDAALYERICHPSFRAVGPLGFVLDRQQWLGRLQAGNYVCTRYDISELSVVRTGDVALALARADIAATYEGRVAPVPTTRVLHIFQASETGWQLLGVQHSGLMQPTQATA